MNVFVIPSWYPSADDPQSGVFTLEQVVALAQAYPAAKFGLSNWGQNAEANLLWAKDHIKNFAKLARGLYAPSCQKPLSPNLWEYYTPAFTWTDKVYHGNIKGILKANEKNLKSFIEQAGSISLLHAHSSFPAGFIAWQLAKKYRLPFIITEHMSPFPFECYLKGGEIMDKVLQPLKAAQAVIAVSPAAAHELEHKTGIRPCIIPNLVNEAFFTQAATSPHTHQKEFTFFSLGRMVPQKGFPDLLQAISIMEEKVVNFRIGGSGACMQKYQQLAQKLGVAAKITWLGELSREQVAAEFAACQAFVLASIHESMGVVFAEALASGKPVIATRCGGPEFIVTPQNGLLSDVHAPHQLASAMDTLIKTYQTYAGNQIRADFLNRFSRPVITKKIYTLYQNILDERASIVL